MPEFMVEMEFQRPDGIDETAFEHMRRTEELRAAQLARDGYLERLWRPPADGKWRNIGIWRAGGLTDLHAALNTLPFNSWSMTTITELSSHPNDPGCKP